MQGRAVSSEESTAHLILVVEDETLVAMELTALLQEYGFRVLGPADSVSAALDLLKHHHPHAAVLDMNLRGEMVTPVAHVLQKMGVPFIIASAYDRVHWPRDKIFDGVCRLGKPIGEFELLKELRASIDRHQSGAGSIAQPRLL